MDPSRRRARLSAALLCVACLFACVSDREPRLERVRDLAWRLREAAPALPASVAAADAACAERWRDGRSPFVPAGERVVLFSSAPQGAVLLVTGARPCAGRGRLRIAAHSDEAAAVSSELDLDGAAVRLPLPAAAGPIRIELEVRGEAAGATIDGLTVALPTLVEPSPQPPLPSDPLDVLVYLVDTLRRDELGCYGNSRGLTPGFDAFAAEGALFGDAVAASSWTRPSVASLFTGLSPTTHGVNDRGDLLLPAATTLAELLQQAGYRTAAFVTNPHVGRRFGFDQGFEVFRDFPNRRWASAAKVNKSFLQWLDETPADGRPFFAYLHTIDPHGPYEPTAPWRERFAPGTPLELGSRESLVRLADGDLKDEDSAAVQVRRLYDADVAQADAAFGALRAELIGRGRWDRTLVIVLSDHGEEFREHGGWEHGLTLHREVVEIPLLVRLPGIAPGVLARHLARHVDLLPTILEAAHAAVPAGLDGQSLLPMLSPSGPRVSEPALSYLQFDGRRAAAVTTHRYRLIASVHPGEPRVALYDRRSDGAEARDVSAQRRVALQYLRSLVKAPADRESDLAGAAGALDAESEARLRGLGY